MVDLHLRNNVGSFTDSETFLPVSGVQLTGTDSTVYSAGDDSGYVVKADCIYASAENAAALLERMTAFEYVPYEATDAIMDPAAEIGDSVEIHGENSGIFSMTLTFGRLLTADIEAKVSEEIEHEYHSYAVDKSKYVTKQELASSSSSGGGGGVTINGANITDYTVVETKIADNAVKARAISPLAVRHEALAEAAVTDLNLYDNAVTGKKIANSAVSTIKIASNAVTTAKTSSGINTSLAYADAANDVLNNGTTASYMITKSLRCTNTTGFYIGSYHITLGTAAVGDKVLKWG